MPGDPLRAKHVAENYLDNPQLVTAVRNVYGYTGTYKGVPVSVMASGMGMPSIGIYSYELFKFYDVQTIIRIGSAGSYTERLALRDVMLASEVYSESSYAFVHNRTTDKVMLPSAEVNGVILAKAEQLGINCKTGKVLSSDVFYGTTDWREVSAATGVECVEMESFALFHNANFLGKRAACLLTISDSLVTGEELDSEARQNTFASMMRLALESAVEL